MNLRLIPTIILVVVINSFNLFSQTCRIKKATLQTGECVYTEVFEYDYVDEKPEFPGGRNSMINFINSNRQYPQEAYEAGIEGRVTCSFVVYEDGKIDNINILRGVVPALNQEAMRIVASMPEWSPGKIKNNPVPVRVICCIPFRK